MTTLPAKILENNVVSTQAKSESHAPTASHTPGPWEYVRDLDYWQIEPTNIGGKDNMEGNEADYRLIAAAPDMLAALKHVTSRADDDLKKHFTSRSTQCAEDYARCVAAIAKAEGRS